MLLLALIYVTAIIVFGFSDPQGLSDSIASLTGHAKVRLSSGSIDANVTSLSAIVTPEDISKLPDFKNLEIADLSGSTCYPDIMKFAYDNPEIKVTYTVPMPNGKTANNDTTNLDLSGLRHEDISLALDNLKFLPYISAIDLGTSSQSLSPITPDDIARIRENCPAASLSYAIDLLGSSHSIYDESIDLTGLTSAQVPETVNAFSYLHNLSNIKIAPNATTDGSLQWSDISAISAAAPNAILDYNFSVCGVNATMADTSIDLSAITPGDVNTVLAVLPGMSQLNYINLGSDASGLSYDDLDKIFAAAPDALISYSTSLWGKEINFTDTVLDFNHISMNDAGAAVSRILPYMRACTILDMDSCDVSNESMDAIRSNYPNIDVIWRVWFAGYSVRTNVETILASKPSAYGDVTDANSTVLKYCTKVKNLDLGHNDKLTDVSFIASMPDLENCILTCTSVNSFEPFRNCTKLDYLESGETYVSDLSPFENLTQIRYLNIGLNKSISDLSPLYNNTNFMKLYLGGTSISQDQINEMESILAATGRNDYDLSADVTYISTNGGTGGYYTATEGMWRYDRLVGTAENWIHAQQTGVAEMVASEKYEQIREIFRYSEAPNCYSTPANDPLYNPHDSIY